MPSLRRVLRLKACKNLTIMQNYLSMGNLYINDFHRSNSMAAQREVLRMSLHPISREQKVTQIERLHEESMISKENANRERNRLHA